MTFKLIGKSLAGLCLVLSLAGEVSFADDTDIVTRENSVSDFSRFAPNPIKKTRLDYSVFDEALSYIVIDMGPSLRTRMARPEASTGTRFVKGHTSPYRMEGSRVTFDYITDNFLEGLTEYRQELEAIGTQIDIASLSKDEQLSYWLNLHNLTVIEQIALAYPEEEPETIKIEINGRKELLDDAKILNVKGQALSLRDIRENIVYQNWSDPVVFYGFYRGDIGSPKINRQAFSANRLDFLLTQNAGEFVNSLRGFRSSPGNRYISKLYAEMDHFYFEDFDRDLSIHLTKYAEEAVKSDIVNGRPFKFDQYENDIADLTNGHRRGSSGLALKGQLGIPPEVERFMRESVDKQKTLINRGLITPRGGYVIIEDVISDEDGDEE